VIGIKMNVDVLILVWSDVFMQLLVSNVLVLFIYDFFFFNDLLRLFSSIYLSSASIVFKQRVLIGDDSDPHAGCISVIGR